jgi:hypothetical protein
MKRILLFCFLALLVVIPAFSQEIYVADFTTEEAAIKHLMTGVSDVFRQALNRSNGVSVTTSPRAADYAISGTVTRVGDRELKEKNKIVESIIQIFDYLFNLDKDKYNHAAYVLFTAQMIDIKTGKFISSGSLYCESWEEYLSKASTLARDFVEKLPFPQTYDGAWRAVLEHDNIEDEYLIIFEPNNQCTLTVTSTGTAWGTTQSQTATGLYRWDGGILNVNITFRQSTISHIKKAEWQAIPSLSSDKGSFDMVIPVSSAQNARKSRVTFWRER